MDGSADVTQRKIFIAILQDKDFIIDKRDLRRTGDKMPKKTKKLFDEKNDSVFGVISPGSSIREAESGRRYKPRARVDDENSSRIEPSYYPFKARVSSGELRRRERKRLEDYAA